jgi:DNA-binding transcriptional MerR regulator
MERLTLTQAAKALGVPQHRLIHLCEEHVVVPDVRGAQGRGSSRAFSARNLFEFAIALEMRRSELPVSFVRAVLQVLRTFETEVRKDVPDFVLPETLRGKRGPQLSLLILDGERLYFVLRRPGYAPTAFGGVDIPRPPVRGRARNHKTVGRLRSIDAKRELGTSRTRTEIDLSAIARDLATLDEH